MDLPDLKQIQKDHGNTMRTIVAIQNDVNKVFVACRDYGNQLQMIDEWKSNMLAELEKLRSQNKKLIAEKAKEKSKFHETVKEIRNEQPTINKENAKKKSSAEMIISPEPESSQDLFKRKPTSSIDRSFSEIANNFKEPSVARKKTTPTPKPTQPARTMKQQTLEAFSLTKNDQSDDATFCEELEGVKKKKKTKTPWLSRSRTVQADSPAQFRQRSLEKSFTRLDTSNKSSELELFQFKKTDKRTPPKEQQKPVQEVMTEIDKTPDLIFSPQKKIKIEQFSEEPRDIFDIDSSSRDSSNSVMIIDQSDHPLTINDSADARRQMLDSLERNLANITEYPSESMDVEPEPAEPNFRQGTRYKDCGDCYAFYKGKAAKKEIVREVHPCRTRCVGYGSRIDEVKEARKTKSMPPPKKIYENTPSGFWDMGFPQSSG